VLFKERRWSIKKLIGDIRKDALGQIIKKAPPMGYHPDSITGISLSIFAAPERDTVSTSAHDERESDALADNEYNSLESDNATSSSSSIALPDIDGDTDDEEGGIWLGIVEAFV
jgi:hypothetical protein